MLETTMRDATRKIEARIINSIHEVMIIKNNDIMSIGALSSEELIN